MKNYNFYLLLIVYALYSQSCDDIIEEDISDAVIIPEAPEDNAQIEGNTVQFRWNEVDGTPQYRLQVSNTTTNSIILDSLLVNTRFDFAISPGTYRWRIRAENSAYQTPYSSENSFQIIESENLENQTIILSNPGDNIVLNTKPGQFSWEAITTATRYQFELFSISNNQEVVVFVQDSLQNTSVNIDSPDTLEDATYKWQVRAKNNLGSSRYFSRTFIIDSKNPPVPTIVKPTVGQQFIRDQEVAFEWSFTEEKPEGINTKIVSILEIASDMNFTNIIEQETASDTQFSYQFTDNGTYYWRIKGTDQANNTGEYNSTGQIVIN
ncbi:hypothetical protein NBT05_17280 [Aquimarina sp. ERC-38]|uniref:hypothetical protein n=1 Tax=Aquimarina sp. ERC-38 TaxID=2949996 RepID=UPI002245766C|nr:hypothetical protein [Aquimarina sp. ERC-38]UZO80681.1 hypothetical protein NBT05_17280 [Aquimarina sp. ERC-38]